MIIFNPNRDWFDPTDLFNLAVDPLYDSSKDPDGDQIDSDGHIKYSFQNVLNKKRSPARTYTMISPRFGVSFPISENSLFILIMVIIIKCLAIDQMFEFIYFRPENIVTQMIAEDQLAAQEGRAPRHIPSNDGDPERVVAYTAEPLKPQKTIMFEAGIKQNFEDIAVLDVTAFYKDVFDQTKKEWDYLIEQLKVMIRLKIKLQQINPMLLICQAITVIQEDLKFHCEQFSAKSFNLDLNYSFSRSTQGRASPKR